MIKSRKGATSRRHLARAMWLPFGKVSLIKDRVAADQLCETLKRSYAGNLQSTNHCLSKTVTKISELTLFQQVFMGPGFQLLVKIAMGFLTRVPRVKKFSSRCT